MAKFKLLAGKHSATVDGKTVKFTPGDVIQSDLDLVSRFGFEKFELIPEATPSTVVDSPKGNEAPPDNNEKDVDEDEDLDLSNLNQYNVATLRNFAESYEIDLDGITKKADIIAAIQQATAE